MDHVSEMREEFSKTGESGYESVIQFKYPDLSHHSMDELIEIKQAILKDVRAEELKNLILNLWNNPTGSFSMLDKLSKEVEALLPWELSSGILRIVVKYLFPLSSNDHVKAEKSLGLLAGKTIVLMENESHYERR